MSDVRVMFGKRVRTLRAANGWSQGRVAKAMAAHGHPMSQQTVAKIEKGTRPTSVAELAALARVFGTSMSDLLAPVDPAISAFTKTKPVVSAASIDLSDGLAEPARKVWRCAVCGTTGGWSDGWRWFGSFRQVEETGAPEFVVCSKACRSLADPATLTKGGARS